MIQAVVGRPKGKTTTEAQSFLFSPKSAWTPSKARAWLRDHGKRAGGVDETGGSYRFRQSSPSRFQKDTFRTITISENGRNPGFIEPMIAGAVGGATAATVGPYITRRMKANFSFDDLRPAVKYVSAIRNERKKRYARAYLEYLTGETSKEPDYKDFNLGYMGGQAVRMSLDKLVPQFSENPHRKQKTREQVEKMQAKAVKFLRDVVKDSDKADEIGSMSVEDYAAKKKVTLSNPGKSKGKGQRAKGKNPKSGYRAWLRIRGGTDRFGSHLFKTRREALKDAAAIIREVKDDPAVEWRHEIETYGTVRDVQNPKEEIGKATRVTTGRGLFGFGKPKDVWQYRAFGKTYQVKAKDKPGRKSLPIKFSIDQQSGDVYLNPRRRNARYAVQIRQANRWKTIFTTDDLEVAKKEAAQRLTMYQRRIMDRGGKGNPRRRNQSEPTAAAAKMYETFHGEASREVLEFQQRAIENKDYAALGRLMSIQLPDLARVIEFPEDETVPLLATNATGTQLYVIGGDQNLNDLLDEVTDKSKDYLDFGRIGKVIYRARKDFDQFEEIDYVHPMGEGKKEKPRLIYDKLNRQIYVVGGEYQVKREGIVH